MATPSLRRSVNRVRYSGQEKLPPLPLVTRRFLAWIVEVLLVIASMLIPLYIGIYIQSQFVGEPVPINPLLAVMAEVIAKAFHLPTIDAGDSNVAPLTNLFWSIALVAPLVLIVWQLYLLAKTGSTLPKRWLSVRVVTATLKPPGLRRVLLREGIGSWGLPLLVAYILWCYSGTSSLSILVGISSLMVLTEGMSARFHPQRRCLHDRLAGTYVIDANRPSGLYQSQSSHGRLISRSHQQTETGEEATLTDTVPKPKFKHQQRKWWRWMRRHPHFVVLLVALFSMATVLGTLVGTQVYVQTQANHRAVEQHNTQQFLTLMKQLSPNSSTTLEERQRAILALGTLKDPQALQLLVNLLGQETNSNLLDKVQQALVNSGPQALPYLQRLNQYLASLLTERYTLTDKKELWTQQLQETQQAIAKILLVYSGKVHSANLNRINLGQTNTESGSFTLVLDKTDLSGIQLKAANLNHASFRGTQFRGPGEDGRLDTSDDWIADLSDAQMPAANLTQSDLSHVLMQRTNLVLATLNRANLSAASLTGANLSSTKLMEANLHAAVLADASLTGANLAAADLSLANLSGARLGQVSALGTKMQSADLSQSDWRGSDLSQADLSHANLSDANFSNTRLTGADFHNAQMTNVNLRNADLNLVDLRGANLVGADLQGAILSSSQSAPNQQFKQINSSSIQSALVKGVDFSKVKNLDTKQVAYICTQGGNHPRCP
ncbi:MAG: pentapeptide repeat-containing protein [Chroococcidiopsidaceae cyanobacterium CP_BM_ER_R8_30]|nr:pentapeptide repeat-containing protein [Chroococcidiopsidaceae cyanobacterium CP_BM_ER_R8_30]